ncbi:MAG TPA: glucose-6-phosphate dehydrogenase assembly protein OpcA [Opitutaceae bacterium]|nr:glucose-6-phosphate dehydrogenase assembly protein OpcA [Opitutaceae bacterium]
MSGIFDALPGMEFPVASISSGLDQMWSGAASEGRPSPPSDDAKAIQVNFVLHLGLRTDSADAVRQFETAVRFSRSYPCRVVVLCPLKNDSEAAEIRAKVYGECSIGKSADDTRCCEFVMLSYPRSARIYLENQVSVCLSTDLPLYYWAHGFSESARLADYRYLLTTAKRVLIDSATAPADAITFPWPRPENVRDLAFARLLPARQMIGQFLSRYRVEALAKGLKSITLSHGAEVSAEARVLMSWVRERIGACGATGETCSIGASPDLAPRAFALGFAYGDRRFFAWNADLASAHATLDGDFGSGRMTMPASIALLPQESALSEAMFF